MIQDREPVPARWPSEPLLLRTQILKLRWIGQDDVADRLAAELARLDTDVILIGDGDTD